eukprot:PhF_6_TR950/c0_g1_i2/m.1757
METSTLDSIIDACIQLGYSDDDIMQQVHHIYSGSGYPLQFQQQQPSTFSSSRRKKQSDTGTTNRPTTSTSSFTHRVTEVEELDSDPSHHVPMRFTAPKPNHSKSSSSSTHNNNNNKKPEDAAPIQAQDMRLKLWEHVQRRIHGGGGGHGNGNGEPIVRISSPPPPGGLVESPQRRQSSSTVAVSDKITIQSAVKRAKDDDEGNSTADIAAISPIKVVSDTHVQTATTTVSSNKTSSNPSKPGNVKSAVEQHKKKERPPPKQRPASEAKALRERVLTDLKTKKTKEGQLVKYDLMEAEAERRKHENSSLRRNIADLKKAQRQEMEAQRKQQEVIARQNDELRHLVHLMTVQTQDMLLKQRQQQQSLSPPPPATALPPPPPTALTQAVDFQSPVKESRTDMSVVVPSNSIIEDHSSSTSLMMEKLLQQQAERLEALQDTIRSDMRKSNVVVTTQKVADHHMTLSSSSGSTSSETESGDDGTSTIAESATTTNTTSTRSQQHRIKTTATPTTSSLITAPPPVKIIRNDDNSDVQNGGGSQTQTNRPPFHAAQSMLSRLQAERLQREKREQEELRQMDEVKIPSSTTTTRQSPPAEPPRSVLLGGAVEGLHNNKNNNLNLNSSQQPPEPVVITVRSKGKSAVNPGDDPLDNITEISSITLSEMSGQPQQQQQTVIPQRRRSQQLHRQGPPEEGGGATSSLLPSSPPKATWESWGDVEEKGKQQMIDDVKKGHQVVERQQQSNVQQQQQQQGSTIGRPSGAHGRPVGNHPPAVRTAGPPMQQGGAVIQPHQSLQHDNSIRRDQDQRGQFPPSQQQHAHPQQPMGGDPRRIHNNGDQHHSTSPNESPRAQQRQLFPQFHQNTQQHNFHNPMPSNQQHLGSANYQQLPNQNNTHHLQQHDPRMGNQPLPQPGMMIHNQGPRHPPHNNNPQHHQINNHHQDSRRIQNSDGQHQPEPYHNNHPNNNPNTMNYQDPRIHPRNHVEPHGSNQSPRSLQSHANHDQKSFQPEPHYHPNNNPMNHQERPNHQPWGQDPRMQQSSSPVGGNFIPPRWSVHNFVDASQSPPPYSSNRTPSLSPMSTSTALNETPQQQQQQQQRSSVILTNPTAIAAVKKQSDLWFRNAQLSADHMIKEHTMALDRYRGELEKPLAMSLSPLTPTQRSISPFL